MPKRKKGYTMPHICVSLNNPRRNVPSEHDKNARYILQQSALDSFHAEINGPVFLSVGLEARLDMFNTFDLDKLFDLHLDSPSSKNPPLCRIIQEGKDPILATDFHLTNIEPKPWILPTPPSNKDTPKPSGTRTADNFTPVIEPDPVQPGQIRLHSWMLYMLGPIYKLAPFINGAAPFSSLKMEQPFINRAAPFSSILLALFINGAAPFSSNFVKLTTNGFEIHSK